MYEEIYALTLSPGQNCLRKTSIVVATVPPEHSHDSRPETPEEMACEPYREYTPQSEEDEMRRGPCVRRKPSVYVKFMPHPVGLGVLNVGHKRVDLWNQQAQQCDHDPGWPVPRTPGCSDVIVRYWSWFSENLNHVDFLVHVLDIRQLGSQES